jgi:tripartite ATP-independent transporter DctM subunit
MSAILVIGVAVLFLSAGTALAYVVGAAAVLAFVASDNIRYLAVLPQRVFSQLDVFALMAMALFILAGEYMNRTGVTRYLVEFSMALVGRFKGGLGHVNIMTSVFFAGVSGSAVADAAALGNTLIPAMTKKGYSPAYGAAVTAASAIIGPIIPPSIILIFYGALMQVSVGGLFAAGLVPGLMLAAALVILNTLFAHRHNHPGGKEEALPPISTSFLKAGPALLLPVIILGGIVFGVVTPTEAAGLAVVCALGAGFIYGGVNRRSLIDGLIQAATLNGSIFIILTAAACFGWIASLEQWPQRIGALVTESGLTGITFLLVVNAFFLLAGMFMDVPMALALLVPLFGPVAISQGVDPIHFGIVICLNLTIGMVTPPIGACLIVVSAISGRNYFEVARSTLPFVAVEVVVLLIITIFPGVSLYLPRILGFV